MLLYFEKKNIYELIALTIWTNAVAYTVWAFTDKNKTKYFDNVLQNKTVFAAYTNSFKGADHLRIHTVWSAFFFLSK